MGACCGFIKPSAIDPFTINSITQQLEGLNPGQNKITGLDDIQLDEKDNKMEKNNHNAKYKLIENKACEKNKDVKHSNSKNASEITGIENAVDKNGKDESKSVLDMDNSLTLNAKEMQNSDSNRRDPEDEYISPNEKVNKEHHKEFPIVQEDNHKGTADTITTSPERHTSHQRSQVEKDGGKSSSPAKQDKTKNDEGKNGEINIEAIKAELKSESRMASGFFGSSGEQKEIRKQMSELKKQVSNLPEVSVDMKKYHANDDDKKKTEDDKNIPMKRYKTMTNPSNANQTEQTENEERKENRTIHGGVNDSLVLDTETNRSGFRKSVLKKQNTIKNDQKDASGQKRVQFDLGGKKARVRKKSRKR